MIFFSISYLNNALNIFLKINIKTILNLKHPKIYKIAPLDTSVVTSNYDTRTEKSNDDISEQSSKIQKSEGAEQLLIIDSG